MTSITMGEHIAQHFTANILPLAKINTSMHTLTAEMDGAGYVFTRDAGTGAWRWVASITMGSTGIQRRSRNVLATASLAKALDDRVAADLAAAM